jgi:hypothetical protein
MSLLPFGTEDLQTLLLVPVVEGMLSFVSAGGCKDVAFVVCSFCWCRINWSFREKHLMHAWHPKGFSFVCERS